MIRVKRKAEKKKKIEYSRHLPSIFLSLFAVQIVLSRVLDKGMS